MDLLTIRNDIRATTNNASTLIDYATAVTKNASQLLVNAQNGILNAEQLINDARDTLFSFESTLTASVLFLGAVVAASCMLQTFSSMYTIFIYRKLSTYEADKVQIVSQIPNQPSQIHFAFDDERVHRV